VGGVIDVLVMIRVLGYGIAGISGMHPSIQSYS
jgi:hypothetical protein